MNIHSSICHGVSIETAVAAPDAFDYLADPQMVGRWALGCFNVRPAKKPGLYQGVSLFDGTKAWFRIDGDPQRLIIDYHVGDADRQLPRISTRIVPGPHYGRDAGHCIVTMNAWRTVDMTEERWQRLCATHEAEILLIQAQLMQRKDQTE
jgi:hypothetical protein